jgi:2'-5' RNA ligase
MRLRRNWRAILRSLATGRRSLDSTLIMPVPTAESALATALDGEAPGDPHDLPPHITVLYPFVPAHAIDAALEAAVVDVLGGFAPFRFRLARVGSFPGVLYLEPHPDKPFLELTEAFCARWPEVPPYRGAFDEIVPHLTVSTGEVPPGLVARLERLLPIEATAREIWLLTQGTDHRWTMRGRFLLGDDL